MSTSSERVKYRERWRVTEVDGEEGGMINAREIFILDGKVPLNAATAPRTTKISKAR